MPKFKTTNFNQHMLVSVDLSKQLLPGTIEAVISQVIDRMDMKAFNERIRNDKTGAPAYNPRILLKIILYAYSRGILSSRRIAEAARNHITFIALSGYSMPDFTTIAAFVSGMQDQISLVFLHVLRVCDKMKLIGGERFALDGHKLSSNAAKEWSGTHAQLQKKIHKMRALIAELQRQHSESDAEEQAELQRKTSRLEKRAEKIETFLAENEPKKPTRKSAKEIQSNITDNESAKIISSHGVIQGYNGLAVADEKNQVIVSAAAHGTGYEGDTLESMLDLTQKNLSEVTGIENPLADKEMLMDANYFKEANLKLLADAGIDAYVPDPMFRKRDPRFADVSARKGRRKKNIYEKDRETKGQIGWGQEDFTYFPDDDYYLCKANHRLNRWGTRKDGLRTYGISSIQHCLHCPLRKDCMPSANPKSKKHLLVGYKARALPYSTAMKAKIDSPEGKKIYAQRMKIIEPVFANTRAHKGMNRFTLRGREKVNIQWLLYMIVHNLSKIARAERLAIAG